MPIDAWLTIAIILLCFSLLAFTRYPADAVFMAGLTLLLLFGVLSPEQAFAGLANEGMIIVGVMYVVVSGLRETGAIAWFVHNVLGRPGTLSKAQFKIMAPVALLSAFMNNTPVVAMMIPAVKDWARRHNISVSKLMIPLSYAAIVGGTCTLIGTSTNLVINDLLIEATGQSLGMFELAWVGVPLVIITLVFTIGLGRFLLPDYHSSAGQFTDMRNYTVEMLVEAAGPLVGKTIEQAGLRNLAGLYLIEIDRAGQLLPAVSPQARLQGNDRLVFAGVVESVVDLQKIRGLTPATDQVFKLSSPRPERCLIEAVVSDSAPFVGKSIRESRFRSLYNAAVIAVARDGESLKMKVGDIVLKPGDTLLIEAQEYFAEQQRNSKDFYLVSRLDDSSPPRHERAWVAFVILAGMVFTVSLGMLSILKAALLAAGLMIITRCTTASDARRNVDWSVLITIAASLGLGQALQVSGAAEQIASGLLAFSGSSAMLMLVMLFAITALLTAMISNVAAAVLMFPIAIVASQTLGVSITPFVIALMIAASVSFATPVGYQTNLMVYGPGGYHFRDYLRIGLPLTVLVGVFSILIISQVWQF